MISAETVHKLILTPKLLTPAEKNVIKSVVEKYPYFIPARYLQALILHQETGNSDAYSSLMELYSGNWLLYQQMLKGINDNIIAAMPVAEKIIKAEEEKEIPKEKTEPTESEKILEEELSHESSDAVIENINHEIELEQGDLTVEQSSPPKEIIEMIPNDEIIIQQVYTEDYFLHQGVQVSDELPEIITDKKNEEEEDKSLLVMMSFTDWLNHFKIKTEKAKEEEEDRKALKSMWQREKLAAALEEENDEIPERVFEMAVNSIAKEEGLISESLAEILLKQGKYDKAIEMYRKLSLRNPQKNSYFAAQIEKILKEKES